MKVLKDSINNGIKYDYVINDLTEYPIEGLSLTVCDIVI